MNSASFGMSSLFIGAVATGLSVVIVLGSILIAITESNGFPSLAAYPTLEVLATLPSPSASPTDSQLPTPTNQPTNTATTSPTFTPSPTFCTPQSGWEAYTIIRGDTLRKLSQIYGLIPQELADANCLLESRLTPGEIIFVPPLLPTNTPAQCGPPSNWVVYIVQSGDTLYSIARRVNQTVSQLKVANCLASDNIRAGQKLYIPFYPPPLPSPTALPTRTATPPPTSTPLPSPTEDGLIGSTPPSYPPPP